MILKNAVSIFHLFHLISVSVKKISGDVDAKKLSLDLPSFSPDKPTLANNNPTFKSFPELFASICDSSRLFYTPNAAWDEKSDFEKSGPLKEDYSDTNAIEEKISGMTLRSRHQSKFTNQCMENFKKCREDRKRQ